MEEAKLSNKVFVVVGNRAPRLRCFGMAPGLFCHARSIAHVVKMHAVKMHSHICHVLFLFINAWEPENAKLFPADILLTRNGMHVGVRVL